MDKFNLKSSKLYLDMLKKILIIKKKLKSYSKMRQTSI